MSGRCILGGMALGMLLLGCGNAEDSEQAAAFRGVRKTLDAYMKALKEGDCKAAYACLSWKRRQEISLSRIEEDYAKNRERFLHRADAKIERMLYDGFRVVAKLVNGDGETEFLACLPEEGDWRIEATGRSYADVVHSYEAAGGPKHPEDRGAP